MIRSARPKLSYDLSKLRPLTRRSRRGRLWYRWLNNYIIHLGHIRLLKTDVYQSLPQLSIYFSKRNTIFTLSKGKHILSRVSNGSVQRAAFKKAVRKRQFPAKTACKEIIRLCKKYRFPRVKLLVRKTGKNRKLLLRLVRSSGIRLYSAHTFVGIPHGGCRAPRKRRL